jgi:pimeloyl-ACP methyl ester carboxylesterase
VLDRLTAVREVVALDLPGFGDVPIAPPPGSAAGIESLTRLVSEFLDDQGLERPHVAGNSLGGWISLELAKRGRARSVTALSPGGFYNSREATFARVSLRMSVRVARLLAPRADRLLVSPLARTLAFSQIAARPKQIPRRPPPRRLARLQARRGSTRRCRRPPASTSAAASRSPCRSRSHGVRRTACCYPARRAAPAVRSRARDSLGLRGCTCRPMTIPSRSHGCCSRAAGARTTRSARGALDASLKRHRITTRRTWRSSSSSRPTSTNADESEASLCTRNRRLVPATSEIVLPTER